MVLYLDCMCQCVCYTRWSGHTSVYLCAALVQNFAEPQHFYTPTPDPVFNGVLLAGFKKRVNILLLAKAAPSLL